MLRVYKKYNKSVVALEEKRGSIIGRYIFTPDIFNLIEEKEKNEHHSLEKVMKKMIRENNIIPFKFEGSLYALENKYDLLLANIKAGLVDNEIREELQQFIVEVSKKLKED